MDKEQKQVQPMLRRLGVEQREYERIEKQLSKRFGSSASPEDVAWAFLNDRLQDAMKRKDWSKMQELYREQALLLCEQGKDFFSVLQEALRCRLMHYKSCGTIEKVKISLVGDSDCCEKCKAQDNKQFTIGEALKTMPIPVKDCGTVWCRCTYLPVT